MQKEAAQGCFNAEEGYGHTYPRVRESFRLDGLQPNACSKQDQLLNFDQIAQGHVQAGLENFQGWSTPASLDSKFQSLTILLGFFFPLQPETVGRV